MKGTVLTVLCAVALTHGSVVVNENGCPIGSNINKLLPHSNCNLYYQCVHGNLLERSCAPGLHFNDALSACDFPEAAKCQNEIIQPENLIANPSKIDCTSGLDDNLAAHKFCNFYYKCSDSQLKPTKCATNLLFNIDTKKCDLAVNVNCGYRTLAVVNTDNSNEDNDNISTGNDNPSLAPSICAATGSEGVLVAHENCNRFYKCSFGLPVALICPSSLLYDPAKERCEWPETVECGERVIIEEEEVEGIEWEGNGAGNDDPSQAAAICATEGSDHSYVAHENCNQFYQCWAGLPVALNCPSGYLFSPQKDYCDFPDNVDCGVRVIPEDDGNDNENNNQNNDNGEEEEAPIGNNYYDPSLAPEICGASDSEGVLVAHEICNQFYKCNYGLPVALICPGDLLFDPSKDRCEWRDTVDCRDREIPEYNENDNDGSVWEGNGAGNDDPSQAPAICSAEGSDHSYVAHENCNQFYQCWAGLPVALVCPPNLFFNPKKDYCDFAQNVDCSNRLIPE